jgi:hypothetical protein
MIRTHAQTNRSPESGHFLRASSVPCTRSAPSSGGAWPTGTLYRISGGRQLGGMRIGKPTLMQARRNRIGETVVPKPQSIGRAGHSI